MKVNDFDFERFKDWSLEREANTLDFLNGKSDSNVHLMEPVGCNYTICKTPQESLECQLEGLTRQINYGGNTIPYLEPWFGVGVFANAFGAEYVWTEGASPQTHYIAYSAEEAEKLVHVDNFDCEAMNLVTSAIDYFVNETKGQIPISLTDTQSPFDTASLLWESSDFFISMFEAPEVVHGLLEKVTQSIIDFSKKQIELLGDTWSRPGHIMASAKGATGIAISDDNIVMLSPQDYLDFAIKYNNKISDEFGGIAIHSCGNYERQLEALMQTKGLLQVDGAFMIENVDPSPNLNYDIFKNQFIGSDIILKTRMNHDWKEPFSKIYDPEIRHVLQVPPPRENEPENKNSEWLKNIIK